MDIAVLLGTLADLQRLFLGDGASFAGLDQVGRKIAEADAAVVLNLARALAVEAAGIAAGTVADGKLALIFV